MAEDGCGGGACHGVGYGVAEAGTVEFFYGATLGGEVGEIFGRHLREFGGWGRGILRGRIEIFQCRVVG